MLSFQILRSFGNWYEQRSTKLLPEEFTVDIHKAMIWSCETMQ
jgi:hypothetical protein